MYRDVRTYQVIIYCGVLAAGVDSALKGAPPGAVAQAMGHTISVAWIAMLIVCPLVFFAGLVFRRWAGAMWLQMSGTMGVGCASAAYVVAVLQATWAERASFAAWVTASLVLCSVLMVVGNVITIAVVWRRMREIGSDSD